jgi:hypothetical protein
MLCILVSSQKDDDDEIGLNLSQTVLHEVMSSDDDIVPETKVKIKPRRICKDTPQPESEVDFFCRQPHVGPEEWKDALQMWEGLFRSEEIDHLPAKMLHRILKQAIRDTEKFKGDKRFDQELLQRWEQEFMDRMDALEVVSSRI